MILMSGSLTPTWNQVPAVYNIHACIWCVRTVLFHDVPCCNDCRFFRFLHGKDHAWWHPNLMTSLGTWKKVSTWAALKWIVQGKLQCLTHTGGFIATISALSMAEKSKVPCEATPVTLSETIWNHQIQPGRSRTVPRCAPSEQWLWCVQLEKRIKKVQNLQVILEEWKDALLSWAGSQPGLS